MSGKMSRDKGARYADIKGYEGLYIASDKGDIISLARNTTSGKVLKPYVNPYNGYCYVTLSKNNKRVGKRVHCLVMRAFNDIKDDGYEIDHKDGNRQNNSLDNLEWVTHQENINRRKEVNYYSVSVIDLDTNVVFKSETAAAQSVGGKRGSAIHRVCVGKRKHYKNHRFAFYYGEVEKNGEN